MRSRPQMKDVGGSHSARGCRRTLAERPDFRLSPPRSTNLDATPRCRCEWSPSSVERRLAMAGVGLVPSPVGLGRHGVAIHTASDKEFLCGADEVAFTEEVRGGAGREAQVAQHLEHFCLNQPDEGGRRRVGEAPGRRPRTRR